MGVKPSLKLPVQTKKAAAPKVMKIDASKPLALEDINAPAFKAMKQQDLQESMWDAPNGPDPAAPPRTPHQKKTSKIVRRTVHNMEKVTSKKATSVTNAVHKMESMHPKKKTKKAPKKAGAAVAARIAAAARAAKKSTPRKANLVAWLASKSSNLMLDQEQAQNEAMELMEQEQWNAMEETDEDSSPQPLLED